MHITKRKDLYKLWRFSTNHYSCSHNIISVPGYSDKSKYIFALWDIKVGEELVRSYYGACVFTPKQERPAVLKNGCPSEVFECSCHACCLEDSAEDDQMRVKTKEMAGMVYNMTNCAVITKEIRQVAIKPFFVLPDTNLAKLAVGFSMYRRKSFLDEQNQYKHFQIYTEKALPRMLLITEN